MNHTGKSFPPVSIRTRSLVLLETAPPQLVFVEPTQVADFVDQRSPDLAVQLFACAHRAAEVLAIEHDRSGRDAFGGARGGRSRGRGALRVLGNGESDRRLAGA